MKRKLQFLIFQMMLIATTMQAQEKVWDFGTDSTNWPPNAAGITTTTTVDGLTLEPVDGTSFGVVEANTATWPDGYASENRFKFGGNAGMDPAGGTDFLPLKRYMTFPVDGPISIKIWFRPSGTSTPRSLFVTDGIDTVVTFYESLGDTDPHYIEADYTGAAGNLYVFCAGNAFNLYKIQISSTLLSNNNFTPEVSTELKAIGDRIYVSNVLSNSTINIYSLTGSLVKSFETTTNVNFGLKTGMYIATIKTNEGQKAVKVIVQ